MCMECSVAGLLQQILSKPEYIYIYIYILVQRPSGGRLTRFTVCMYVLACVHTFLPSTYSPSHRMAAPVVQAAVDEDAGCGAGDRPGVCSGCVVCWDTSHIISCSTRYILNAYMRMGASCTYVCTYVICILLNSL